MTAQKQKTDRRVLMIAISIVMVLGGGIAGAAYWAVSEKSIYIEDARIEAPVVNLAPQVGGDIRAFFVSPGEIVPPNTVVAQVGVELIKSSAGGLVLATKGDVGTNAPAGQPVVTMVDPQALRVVGSIQEDKGLSDVRVGQVASFTVDAFGSKKFSGVVSEVSPSAASGDVVFSVSDKRQLQDFDVKVRYDVTAHPELKQGMSAKLRVYKE